LVGDRASTLYDESDRLSPADRSRDSAFVFRRAGSDWRREVTDERGQPVDVEDVTTLVSRVENGERLVLTRYELLTEVTMT